MAEIVNARYLPSGWLFAIKGGQWIGGLIAARLPLASNQINVLLVRQLAVSHRTKPWIAIGVRKEDVSYDAATKTITLAAVPRVKGAGYDTLAEALQAIRNAVIADDSFDVGDLRQLKKWLERFNSLLVL